MPGAWRLLGEAPIYVFASELGVAAMSARCTHLGCAVRRRGDGFECPCHGSTFDSVGNALTPPATAPLSWLRVQLISGDVYIDPDSTVIAGTYVGMGGQGG